MSQCLDLMPQKKAKLGPSSSQTSPPRHIALLDFPAELRLEIYRHCFPRDKLVKATDWPPRPQVESAPGSETEEEDEREEDEVDNWEEGGDILCADIGGNRQVAEEAEELIRHGQIDAPNPVRPTHMRPSNVGLFVVSKQISEETLDLLYGENIFEVFFHGESTFREIFPSATDDECDTS